jgi:Heterokaryon incompatibility protein (HET)
MDGISHQNLYVYDPFKAERSVRHIRLCRLFPARLRSDEIRCELFSTSLEAKEDFEALSYTWGDLNNSQPITVHDKVFHATQNLALALRHLRHEDRDRILWIDALCINQSDLLEKNEQVCHMKDIFSPGGARQVIVWLGTIPNARGAIQFCNRMNECIMKQSEWTTQCQEERKARVPYVGKSLTELPYDDKAARHAANLLGQYMEVNGHTGDLLRYFGEQIAIRNSRCAEAQRLLVQIDRRPNSQSAVSYLVDQCNTHNRACEAVELLLGQTQIVIRDREQHHLHQQQFENQSVPAANGDKDSRTLRHNLYMGDTLAQEAQNSLTETASSSLYKGMTGLSIASQSNPGRSVWDQVQESQNCRQAARYLWEKMDEETEQAIASQRVNEMRKDYKAEDETCQTLFINASWWKRIWILQEVIHSGKVLVLLSREDTVTFEELLAAYDSWNKWHMLHKGKSAFTPEYVLAQAQPGSNFGLQPIGPTEQDWYDFQFNDPLHFLGSKSHLTDLRAAAKVFPTPTKTTYPLNLAGLIMNFRDHNATDPRDMLYALLGMAAPGSNGSDLVVDYRTSVREVYTIVARKLMKAVLILLLWIESPERPITAHGELPSWVPDYRTKQRAFPRTQVTLHRRFSADAGFSPPAEMEPRFRQAADEKTLVLRGLYIGVVTDTFDALLTDKATPVEHGAVRLIAYDSSPELRFKDPKAFPPPDRSAWDRPDPVKDSSWGPIHAEIGDWIFVVPGIRIPIITRPIRATSMSTSELGVSELGNAENRCLFVGGCWLVESRVRASVFQQVDWTKGSGFSPIMFGSAVRELPPNWKPEEFVLV